MTFRLCSRCDPLQAAVTDSNGGTRAFHAFLRHFLCLLAGGFVLPVTVACGGPAHGSGADDDVQPDVHAEADGLALPDLGGSDLDAREVVALDAVRDAEVEAELACEPGSGGFGCACDGIDDCLSGYCVLHQGERRCSIPCEGADDCSDGWACTQASGTDPTFVCLSKHPHLCLPCAATADCQEAGGLGTEVCVAYGNAAGSFCGGLCLVDADCPAGSGCADAVSVERKDSRLC